MKLYVITTAAIAISLHCSQVRCNSINSNINNNGVSSPGVSGDNDSKSSGNSEKPKVNVLEVITGMGKAIQLLLNQNGIQQTATAMTTNLADNQEFKFRGENLAAEVLSYTTRQNYREQAESLRVEIAKRSGQLQKVVLAAIEVLRDRGDVVFRRILENVNSRIDLARTRADTILKEPATSEVAIKTLNTINQGLNNINSLIQHVLSRINIRINVDVKEKENGKQMPVASVAVDKAASSQSPAVPV